MFIFLGKKFCYFPACPNYSWFHLGHNFLAWSRAWSGLVILTEVFRQIIIFDLEKTVNSILFYAFDSLLLLAIPITFNFIIAFLIFVREQDYNEQFLNWLMKNSKVAALFSILAAADIEALTVLYSNVAGLSAFSAKFSEKALSIIFWGSTLNMFMEDLPQLIVQVHY